MFRPVAQFGLATGRRPDPRASGTAEKHRQVLGKIEVRLGLPSPVNDLCRRSPSEIISRYSTSAVNIGSTGRRFPYQIIHVETKDAKLKSANTRSLELFVSTKSKRARSDGQSIQRPNVVRNGEKALSPIQRGGLLLLGLLWD
jgi:hypothetical protein